MEKTRRPRAYKLTDDSAKNFEAFGTARLRNVLRALSTLRKLSDRSHYACTREQLEYIENAITTELVQVMASLRTGQRQAQVAIALPKHRPESLER